MSLKKSIAGIIFGSLCSTLLLSTAMAAAPMASPAKPAITIQSTKPIYTWHTESEKNKSGKFDHCLVKNMYDNGTLMILAQNNNGEKRIALNFPQNKMETDQHFDLAIQIDRRDVFPVEAIALNPQTLAIAIPEALPEQMRKGQLLHLRGPSDEVVFALDGMDGAVASLKDCMISQKNIQSSPIMTASNDVKPEAVFAPIKPEAEIKPAAPEPQKTVLGEIKSAPEEKVKPIVAATQNPIPDKILPPAAPVAVATVPVSKIESTQDGKVIEVASDPAFPQPWAGIFSGTTYSPEHLIPMKNKTPDQPLDYIWKKEDVFFGVKNKAVKPGDALAAMSTDYLKMLKTRCAGNFVAESTQVQQSAKTGISWQEAEAACSNNKNGDSIAATIFAFTPAGGQIYFFESKANQGAGAIKARDTILNKILQ